MGKNIIFIGDSLIEWFDWAARFPGHRVHNLGISGETVEWMLDRVPRVTQSIPRADKVFVLSGINNVSMDDTGFLRPYKRVLAEFRSAWPEAEIYVISLLPTLLGWIMPDTIMALNSELSSLAREMGARYIDAHDDFIKHGLRDMLTEDGIHISEAGYAVLSASVAPYIS